MQEAQDKRASYYSHRLQNPPVDVPSYDATSVELILNFFFTYDVLESVIARGLASYGLSPTAFNVMMILRGSQGFPLRELGDLLLTSRANVTGLVDCLAQKGMVTRDLDPHDRRSRIARLTEEGEALLQTILPSHYARVAGIFKNLGEAERKQLSNLLAQVRNSASPLKHLANHSAQPLRCRTPGDLEIHPIGKEHV